MNEINNKILAITDLAMKISCNSRDIKIDWEMSTVLNTFTLSGYTLQGETYIFTETFFPGGRPHSDRECFLDSPNAEYKLDYALVKLEKIWAEICKEENAA